MALNPRACGDIARPRAIGHAVNDGQSSAVVARLTLEPHNGTIASSTTVENLLAGKRSLRKGRAL